MLPPPILLISCDAEIERAVGVAAGRAALALVVARTSHEAVRLFSHGFAGFSLILVDLDPALHGVTLFNALDDVHGGAPIVAITDCEEGYMTPIALAHGAAACLGKPLGPSAFEPVFTQFCHLPAV